MTNLNKPLIVAMVLLCMALPAHSYIDMAPTLGKLVRDSQKITVVEVDKFSRDKGAIILKKVRDLKGQTDASPIKHQLAAVDGAAIPRSILEWAEPGRQAVMFVSSNTALVCLGRSWYQVQSSSGEWWKIGPERPDLPLAYFGSMSRLRDAVELMVAGKTAVITMVPHGTDGAASVDLALNRPNLPALVKLQRIRANIRMPQVVMGVSANPAYLIGQGAVGEEEIPALIQKLGSTDAPTRAESAADLGTLGAKATPAVSGLLKMLDDPAAPVRLSAAAALLRISPAGPVALDTLTAGLNSPDATVRRCAARATGSAGSAAAPLAGKLATLLSDSDELTRAASLEAIATLGASGAPAMEAVVKLLDNPQTASDAADALGRMGSAARPSLKRLAQLLSAEPVSLRWAAVRAMSQIGGDDAAPAVQFMIRQLPNASEVDGYNMMIYLALLGPVAKDALPAMQNARIRQPVLKSAAMWAIEPENRFPWQTGGNRMGMMGDGNVVGSVFECLVNELGDHLRPVSRTLAQKIMDGSVGEMPLWGYKILSRFPDEAIGILAAGLADKDIVKRERAVVALGYMASAAAPSKGQVAQTLRIAPTEREQRLIKWCLREIGQEPGSANGRP